ncbi:plasmid mobilization relaxosome protein MobC [Staphylococcus sp. GDY8P85P]|uniref:plasmid mobilization relaxosome protein MobC n=1 Tax=Staphylococcus sp. GDY8P85P TaxID=2804138 RepID=UPI001AEBB9D7|nr:plasmid mobilization relaxosome protein MobC [Staphylococcus sp. GDY8P85P]
MSETKNEERDKMLRTRNHTFKLNEVEDNKLKTLRDITGLSISQIVRNTLFSEQSILSSGHISNAEEFKNFRQAQVKMMKQLEEEKRAINQIGNNLNQIARNTHRMAGNYEKELKQIEMLLKELITNNEEVVSKIWRQQ